MYTLDPRAPDWSDEEFNVRKFASPTNTYIHLEKVTNTQTARRAEERVTERLRDRQTDRQRTRTRETERERVVKSSLCTLLIPHRAIQQTTKAHSF